MDLTRLFADHLRTLQESTAAILNEQAYDGLVISSGQPFVYFADDRDAPFEPTPHFTHWCPDRGAHHLLHIRPGEKPRLLRYAPADFWYEHQPLSEADRFWSEQFAITEVGKREDLARLLGPVKHHAFIGPEEAWAASLGMVANAPALVAPLDWQRGLKSDYEVACLSTASEMAARGHRAARQAFMAGGSELAIHHAYVEAIPCHDSALPYSTIVGLDAKSAVLHYQNKRIASKGGVLLIDAGARFHGYCSDITRTYAKDEVNATFRSLLARMEVMQQELCGLMKAGCEYADLHDQSHQRLAAMLIDHDILRQCSVDEAIGKGFTRVFFPHGLGHLLGIQVHDVAGRQINAKGDPAPPPEKYPHLRTARALREREVITMEPGLYFIPMLLEPMRGKEGRFNFALIDQLTRWGGIRIEDDLLVGRDGPRNLTREFLGNDLWC